MTRQLAWLLLVALSYVVSGFPGAPKLGTSEGGSQTVNAQTAPAIAGVTAANTKIQLITDRLQGATGLVTAPDGTLLVAEPSANRVSRIDADGRLMPYLSNTNGSVALAFDANGRLIAAQAGNPQIAVLSPTRDVLADAFDGQPLPPPGDLTIDARGGMYFSVPSNVLYIRPDGEVIKAAGEVDGATGVRRSPEGKILYLTTGESVMAFDVGVDGVLTNRRDVARAAGAAGITVDAAGRAYVATAAGVQVISPQGRVLGTIPIQGAQAVALSTNRKTLYIASRNSAWRISLQP